ncbi:MAG: aldo/keto reductase [Parvularculaceae bacterium]
MKDHGNAWRAPGRRKFLAGAGAAMIAPAFSASAFAAGGEKLFKTIPSTGEKIPAIGMGSWLTFDVGANEDLRAARTDVLKTFFDLGGALVDSSPMYGTSQSVIGDALSRLNRPDALFAADKVWINARSAGPAQIEESRRHWGVEQFDLLQVHNLVSWRAHLDTLFAMKADGRLRYVGITSYDGIAYDEVERVMRDHPVDFVQVSYNLGDRRAEQRLLPAAQDKGVAVIANRPFQEGSLIDAAMRHKLPAMGAEIGAESWAQFLLKFIVSHPAVTAAIPATRRADHMRENMGALLGPQPDAAFRAKMKQAFDAL